MSKKMRPRMKYGLYVTLLLITVSDKTAKIFWSRNVPDSTTPI